MKLGVIGSYGHVGEVLRGWREVPGLSLAAAARWGSADALRLPGEYVPADLPLYDDFRSMLEEVQPDLAAVFTPLHLLAETSLAAVEGGCHVFSEKPLAISLEDLTRLREATARAGVQVAACLTSRGDPAFLAARNAVSAGRIGRVICAAAQKSYPFHRRDDFYKRRETYGGTIPWIGIHALDFISFVTGEDYRRVAAMASNLAHPTHPGMEDQGGMLLELTGGGSAVVNFDYLRPWGKFKRPWGDDRLRVAGTEGVIEVRDGRATLATPDAFEELALEPARNVFVEFARALAGDGESLVSTEESFRLTEVALKGRQAQDGGQIVEL